MFLARLLSFALALVFLWAAASKLLDRGAWRAALSGYRLPRRVAAVATGAVPIFEACVAGLFFFGWTRVGAAVTLGLVAVFSLTIMQAQAASGGRLPCGCFGSHKERDFRTLLARNTVLAVGAGVLLVYGRDVPGYPSVPSEGAWLPAALVAAGVALIAWLYLSVRAGFRRDMV